SRQPSYVFAQDEGVDMVRPFVRINGLQITHMTEHWVLQGDSACSHQISREPRRFEGNTNVIAFGHGRLREMEFIFVFQAAQAPREQLTLRDLREHVSELLLD